MANGELAPIWKVTRLCCTSGQCIDCHRRPWPRGSYDTRDRRARVVHADNLTKPTADKMTAGWRDYDARTEAM